MSSIPTPQERTRKAYALALQRLAERSQVAMATAMGTSESTINRIKTERLEEALTFLAHLGLKVVPAEFKCVEPSAYAFLTATHQRLMTTVPHLIWEQEE